MVKTSTQTRHHTQKLIPCIQLSKQATMGCVMSSSTVVVEYPTFDACEMYIHNLSWCRSMSHYIESLCFLLANYDNDRYAEVKKELKRLMSHHEANEAYKEVERWLATDDIADVYIEAMASVRMHALKNKIPEFKQVARVFLYVIRAA